MYGPVDGCTGAQLPNWFLCLAAPAQLRLRPCSYALQLLRRCADTPSPMSRCSCASAAALLFLRLATPVRLRQRPCSSCLAAPAPLRLHP